MFILVGFLGFLGLFAWWVYDAFQIPKWCEPGRSIEGQATEQTSFGPTPGSVEPPMTNAA